MAQVAIIVNGPADPRKTEIARALGVLLGCPVLDPTPVHDAITRQTGPVAPRAGVRELAIDTVWRTAALVEAGVIVDSSWEAADSGAVARGLAAAGSPRAVEVSVGGAPLELTPLVRVDDVAAVDMDALVQEISARFV